MLKAVAKTIGQNIGVKQVIVVTFEVLTFQKEELIITHILRLFFFAKRNTEMQTFERFTVGSCLLFNLPLFSYASHHFFPHAPAPHTHKALKSTGCLFPPNLSTYLCTDISIY